jgi:hypothetical protein
VPNANVEILKKLLAWIEKPSPRIGGTVLLASLTAICLLDTEFLPGAMKTAVKPYEVWIWLAFVVALSLLVTYPIEWVWKAFALRRKQKLASRKRTSRLQDLTVEERYALQPLFEKNARTIPGHPNDRVIASLIRDGILVQVTQFGFRISEDAWQYLRENLSLIATPDNPRPPLTGNEWMQY